MILVSVNKADVCVLVARNVTTERGKNTMGHILILNGRVSKSGKRIIQTDTARDKRIGRSGIGDGLFNIFLLGGNCIPQS